VSTKLDAKNPLSLPLSDFTRDFNVNTTSAFVAAQQAVLSFEHLPASASKTFIFTGNIMNQTIILPLFSNGVGKAASAHIIQSAAAAYSDRGYKYVFLISISPLKKLIEYRFYYADERNDDGSPAYGNVDGPAHGEHYLHLSEGQSQGPWQQTFVKGIGYKRFL
jgi:hypothetical protein